VTVIEAIPEDRQRAPKSKTVVIGPGEVLVIINNWAFTQGYVFITKSGGPWKARFACFYHRLKTRNSRKLEEKDRKRVLTFI
jgi:hypothetical protein